MSRNKGRTRVVKSENILAELVPLGEAFRIGLAFDNELLKNVDLKKFGLSNVFQADQVQMPKAAGPRSRGNYQGLYVRKQPEEKHEIKKHIKYKKKDGTKVEYDRTYNVYVKELLDKLNIGLTFMKDEEGKEFIVSPPLMYDDEYANSKKNTHVINLFLEIFHDYEILRENLEYYFKAESHFDEVILPAGELSDPRVFSGLVSAAQPHVKDDDKEPFIERLNVFKEFGAIAEKGKGYNGYFALIFEDKRIVAAESIKKDQATYFFKIEDYRTNIMKDKQEVLHEKLMLRRYYHTDDWERNVRRFLNQH